MADFQGTTTVDAPDDVLFAFLSDVRNLPRYFARMTSAEPGRGDEVLTTATMPDGTTVEGRAWFTVEDGERHIAWGSEGESGYRGDLDVRSTGDRSSEVEVHLHTERVDAGDPEVQQGVDQTLDTIKQLVEEQGVLD